MDKYFVHLFPNGPPCFQTVEKIYCEEISASAVSKRLPKASTESIPRFAISNILLCLPIEVATEWVGELWI